MRAVPLCRSGRYRPRCLDVFCFIFRHEGYGNRIARVGTLRDSGEGDHRRLGISCGEVRRVTGTILRRQGNGDFVQYHVENVYVDLKTEDLQVESLGSYINHVDRLCNSVDVRNWTGCSQFRESIADRFRHLQGSEKLLRDTVGKRNEDSRRRRGVLNFVSD